ncbi:ycf3-interacting protein 1, chloroplastic [Mangifera indica]|uniref:ycf3-interacting protein 1, chloroplastic n=1 Tax=Mangifera indica TaxID=29780 RepID=UPI001CFA845B|nr:ycf3-interacting protein 1, chloroplastic [Mangifera indica]
MAAAVALQQFQLPITYSSSLIFFSNRTQNQKQNKRQKNFHALISQNISVGRCISNSQSKLYLCNNKSRLVAFSGKEDTELQLTQEEEKEEEEEEATPEDLEYIAQVKRVLELLKKNRDMLFSEVKLTITIEDPREVERRRLLGIEDADAPTRDDLAEALEQVNEGKVPKDRVALRMLAEEMMQWPNLEVEAPKKKSSKSPYARVTDTGIDPELAAKRLNVDWDSAAEIGDADDTDETEVPQVVGYGALYLVTAFPVIIGISVVLILFYNSLQ